MTYHKKKSNYSAQNPHKNRLGSRFKFPNTASDQPQIIYQHQVPLAPQNAEWKTVGNKKCGKHDNTGKQK